MSSKYSQYLCCAAHLRHTRYRVHVDVFRKAHYISNNSTILNLQYFAIAQLFRFDFNIFKYHDFKYVYILLLLVKQEMTNNTARKFIIN